MPPKHFSCWLFSLCLLLASTAFAAEEPLPHWMWTKKSAATGEMAYFRKTFEVEGKVNKAVLEVAGDDTVAVFVNGEHLLEHHTWQRAAREDITKRLVAGKNVIALRAKNNSGPAAVLANLTIETDKGKQTLVSDKSWLAIGEPEENWRVLEYDESAWKPAVSLGALGVGPWGALAIGGRAPKPISTPVDSIQSVEGFKVERLYSVPKETQGSWVSMTPDPKGRLIVSDQYGGLYRVTVGKTADDTVVEPLQADIGDAQGLLYAFDSLYVMVNGSAAQGSGFYRLRDTNGDDQFDEVKLLKRLRGGGEHGPHGIRLGPDGKLYVIAGNHTEIPEGCAEDSPHRNWAEDLLLPRNPDGNGHATGRMAPGGWVARTDPDGETWELFCAGFRNPYDIDFNLDGELFTYDADMEWDTGAPWYRPTRVNHCVSAAEFGWRYGTGKWPDYFADSHGAVVDIGLGSPTGIGFGTGAAFPEKYQRALYINDWTYGKIYAVHMTPQGAGYTATFETFVQGKPLPVTDIAVNHDGALYFTVGGRRTQSGLYRVTYTGDESTATGGSLGDPAAEVSRNVRRGLEAFHGKRDPRAIETAWPYLNSTDRHLRYAARVAIEHQDPQSWVEKALAEKRPTAAIYAMLALVRAGEAATQEKVIAKLNSLPLERMSEEQLLAALRTYDLSFIRQGKPSAAMAESVIERVGPLYPAVSDTVNRELCRLLVYLAAPQTIDRTLALLKEAQTQQDQLYYVFQLRNLAGQMTDEQARTYFSWCNLAETSYRGGNSFKKFVQQIRRDAVAKLPEARKKSLAEVIEGKRTEEVVKLETTRQFVHNWQMDDLESLLAEVESGRSFERGKAAFQAAQCAKCHRFAGEGGDTGPDITGVGNRFTPQYLLESLIVPSKAVSDQYINTVFVTGDGEVITGRVVSEEGGVLKVRTNPFEQALTEIRQDNIDEQTPSRVSEMPQGLVNVLSKEEILDLIAYLRSAGSTEDKAFQAE
ncbi:MAG: c-type cytochrome [Pirellulaceae bacterium]